MIFKFVTEYYMDYKMLVHFILHFEMLECLVSVELSIILILRGGSTLESQKNRFFLHFLHL